MFDIQYSRIEGLRRINHLMEANLDLTTGASLHQSCLSHDIVKNRLGLGSQVHKAIATVDWINFASQGSRVGNRRWQQV